MRNFAANAGLRKRYLLSFMLVALIPALVVLTLYIPVINLFREEAIQTDSLRTNTIQVAVEERMQEMHNLSVQISSNKKVTEFLYKEAPLDNTSRYYIRDLSDYIKSCSAGNNFVSLIAVYLIQSSSVVTRDGVYPSDYFFENVLQYEGMQPSEAKKMMSGYAYNRCLPIQKIKGHGSWNGEYVTYLQTVPIGDPNVLANVIMLIDGKDIQALTGETDESFNHQTMILSREGNILFSEPEGKKLSQMIFQNIGKGNSGSFVMDLPDQPNMVFCYSRSRVNQWTFITSFSMKEILLRIGKIRNNAIAVAMIGLSIGIFLSLLMADSSYRPWALLIAEMKQLFSKSAEDSGSSENEYDIAMHTIQGIRAEREQMLRDRDERDACLQKVTLQNFCSGKASSYSEKDWEPVFPYPHFCVILVDVEEEAQWIRKVDRTLNKLVSVYLRECRIDTFEDEKGRLCIVLNTGLSGEARIVEQIRSLAGSLGRHFDILLYTGIGSIYEGVDDIYSSCQEAEESLEYCFLKGRDSVVYYADIRNYIFRSLNIPVYSDNPLLNSVKTGDIRNCTRLLDEYFNDIKDSNCVVSAQYMYCLFYNFIGVIIKACSDMRIDFEVIFHQTTEQVLDLGRYRNAKQMMDDVYRAYLTTCEYVQSNKTSRNRALKEHFQSYLENNYTDPGISLEQTAGTLGYSSSYLSRFIKQEFGMGFGELLNQIRLNHAKRLLSSDLMSVGAIAEEVGYTSINSFIRAFKRREGSTPNQYRNASCFLNPEQGQ